MQISKLKQKLHVSTATTILVATMALFSSTTNMAADMSNGANNFYQSHQVTSSKSDF